jgi:hypothetical protein
MPVMKMLSKLFKRKRATSLDSYEDAVHVATEFGELLERNPMPYAGIVADVDELSHNKNDIKKALLIVLLTVEDQSTQKALIESYLSLAYWQPGVGPQRVGLDLSSAPRGIENMRSSNWLAQFGNAYDQWKKWENVVEKEQNQLLNDLRALGLQEKDGGA